MTDIFLFLVILFTKCSLLVLGPLMCERTCAVGAVLWSIVGLYKKDLLKTSNKKQFQKLLELNLAIEQKAEQLMQAIKRRNL